MPSSLSFERNNPNPVSLLVDYRKSNTHQERIPMEIIFGAFSLMAFVFSLTALAKINKLENSLRARGIVEKL
ncbi:MAG: hypothetical protein AAF329_22715, partial [Cyanobacteria bacterium P01_A01_bin.17]